MTQEKSLPDYADPPLDEVVLGVQFSPPSNYTSVHAYRIWELFRSEFPIVEEVPPLDPQVETFGGVPGQEPSVTFGPSPVRGRLWFISADRSHLIQFQENRFLLNWRRRPAEGSYPRFAGILSSFNTKLEAIASYFKEEFATTLKINQAEITYFNLIEIEEFAQVNKWVRLPAARNLDVESVSYKVVEVLSSVDGPYGRFFNEIQSVSTKDRKKKALRWSLTFRGKPKGKFIGDCQQFFDDGHYRIVSRFDEFSTKYAHKFWGKNNE